MAKMYRLSSNSYAGVLQIPSYDNDCNAPTLLVGPDDAEFFCAEDDTSAVQLDEVLSQVQEYYSHDPEALHRFSYYLLLKAQEILENNKRASSALTC